MSFKKSILLFADRLPPLVGGMEMHAHYFINHFINNISFPLRGVVSKTEDGQDILITKEGVKNIDLKDLSFMVKPKVIFFNSGRWIEEMGLIRLMYPQALLVYRTGGNEILKAPLIKQQLNDHNARQAFWAVTLNTMVDLLITNSAFTESRLREVGITCPFVRCVGGVNVTALQPYVKKTGASPFTIFCAARFVAYKNHILLISVIHELILRGHDIRLRLAGDGPLLEQVKNQVMRNKLNDIVTFLGVIDNNQVGQEIASAHIYMQLSADHLTRVPGGSYIHSEGMGRSILEALVAGTFVIAGRSGALPEIVTEDKGLLVDLDDAPNIADKVEQILMELPIVEPCRQGFSWLTIFKTYEGLFEDAF